MISIDPGVVGTVEELDPNRHLERVRYLEYDANLRKDDDVGKDAQKKREEKRMKGRSKIGKKLGRNRMNVIDERAIYLWEVRAKEMADKIAMVGLVSVGAGDKGVRGEGTGRLGVNGGVNNNNKKSGTTPPPPTPPKNINSKPNLDST